MWALELLNRNNMAVIPNVNGRFPWECDLICITGAGYVTEFEIKTSKADLKADFKKRKHDYYRTQGNYGYRIPNRLVYVLYDIPDWSDVEIPARYGVVELWPAGSRRNPLLDDGFPMDGLRLYQKEDDDVYGWYEVQGPVEAMQFYMRPDIHRIRPGNLMGSKPPPEFLLKLASLGSNKIWRSGHRWCRECMLGDQ